MSSPGPVRTVRHPAEEPDEMTTTEPPTPTRRVTEAEVLHALPRAVVVTDANGCILLWNDEAETLYGWAEAEVMGRPLLEVLVPLDEHDEDPEELELVGSGDAVLGDRLVARR